MTPDEHAKAAEVFAEAIRLTPSEREEFVRQRCGQGTPVYREVLSLLRFHRDKTILESTEKSAEDSKGSSTKSDSPARLEPYLVPSGAWEASRQLLRRRLIVIALALAILSAASMLRLLTARNPDLGYGIRILATFVSGAIAWLIYRKRDISFASLRAAELIVLLNVCLLETVVFVRCVLDFAQRQDVATVVGLNDWHYIVWSVVIFVYGVFMPNTWQRAAAVLIPAATIPLAVSWGLGLYDPSVATMIAESQFGQPFLAPFAAAGVAIYAAHSLRGAWVSAFEARELAQYRLIRRIGSGGMGEVYEAEHLQLKRACAVKRIRRELSTNDRLVRRFEREVRAAARLTHPHTIEIYDYGNTKDGVFYFAMELLPGMNLRELVRKDGPLPPHRAVHFLIQVCDALTEAHQAGMIHRDIKPANVFASQRGGIYDFTKLLDFGVVREIKLDGSLSLTSKLVAGTPSFMSPEQASSPETIDARSDLYSVGAVGYFLLSGRPPLVGKSPMEVLMAVVEQVPEPLSAHRPDVPADLERVLMRCLTKDPDQRYASARALREELAQCECAGRWTQDDAAAWWMGVAAASSETPACKGGDTLLSIDTELPDKTSVSEPGRSVRVTPPPAS